MSRKRRNNDNEDPSEKILRALKDYLEGRGRFDRSEYYGMRASAIPELLWYDYEELPPNEQTQLIRILSEIVVGKRIELDKTSASGGLGTNAFGLERAGDPI